MNEYVTIKRSEYDKLVSDSEMLQDIAAYDAAMNDGEDAIPQEFVLRILDGESTLAVLREWRGFNQSSLARASGVNRTQIADIEAGRSNPSVATLKKLAKTLDMKMDDLV